MITTILETMTELDKKQRIMIKDVSNCKKFDDLIKDDTESVKVHVINWARLQCDDDDKTFKQIVIVAEDGTKYVTGSSAFESSFFNIAHEMDGEDFTIEVFKKPAKNYKGKFYLNCAMIG